MKYTWQYKGDNPGCRWLTYQDDTDLNNLINQAKQSTINHQRIRDSHKKVIWQQAPGGRITKDCTTYAISMPATTLEPLVPKVKIGQVWAYSNYKYEVLQSSSICAVHKNYGHGKPHWCLKRLDPIYANSTDHTYDREDLFDNKNYKFVSETNKPVVKVGQHYRFVTEGDEYVITERRDTTSWRMDCVKGDFKGIATWDHEDVLLDTKFYQLVKEAPVPVTVTVKPAPPANINRIQLPGLRVEGFEKVFLNRRGKVLDAWLICRDAKSARALLYVSPESKHSDGGAFYNYTFQLAKLDKSYTDQKHYNESDYSFIDVPGTY